MENDSKTAQTKDSTAATAKHSPEWWCNWIKDTKQHSKYKRWKKNTKQAENEYNREISEAKEAGLHTSDLEGSTRASFSDYHGACKIMEPALYARSPKLKAKRRWGFKDQLGLTMSLIVDRTGEYLKENCQFDDAMTGGRSMFIHGDKAALQVVLEPDYVEEMARVPVQNNGQGQFLTEGGEVVDAQTLQADPTGVYSLQPTGKMVPKNGRIKLLPIPYGEHLHTPDAKNEEDIYHEAFYVCITRAEAEARFEKDVLQQVNWTKKKTATSAEESGDDDENESLNDYLELWECYSKETKKVYLVSEQMKGTFIEEPKKDPYGFQRFVPRTSFIISSKPVHHLWPTSTYVHCKFALDMLDVLAERQAKLVDGIRRRALVDGAFPELITALNSAEDNEYVAIQGLEALLESGDLTTKIYWIDLRELVESLKESVEYQKILEEKFNLLFGTPDIMRGQTDPLDGVGTQMGAAAAAQDRFKYNKRLVQRLAKEGLNLMLDLALKVYDDQKFMQICGFETLEEGHKQRFFQALAKLRNDEIRLVTLDIETDSTNFIDETLRAQQMNQVATTIVSGLDKVAQTAQIAPPLAGVMLNTLLATLESLPGGDMFEDEIRDTIDAMMKQMMAQPVQGQQPEQGPDPKMIEAQTKLQIATIEAKTAEAQRQLDVREQDLKAKEAKMEYSAKLAEIQKDREELQSELSIARGNNEVQILEARIDQLQSEATRYKEELETLQAEMRMGSEQMEREQRPMQPPLVINIPKEIED